MTELWIRSDLVKAKLRAGGCAAAVGEPVAPLAADRAAPAAQRAQVKSKELEARQRAALAHNLLKQLVAGKAVGPRLFQQIENEFGTGAK